jgi:hypothetical protein
MKPHLLIVKGDVEPELVGPFNTPAERDRAARAYRAEHGTDDGLYRLEAEGRVEVSPYGATELSDG